MDPEWRGVDGELGAVSLGWVSVGLRRVQIAQGGWYGFELSSSAGNAEAALAVVKVEAPVAPRVAPLGEVAVEEGETAVFRVDGEGTGPLEVEWRVNDVV